MAAVEAAPPPTEATPQPGVPGATTYENVPQPGSADGAAAGAPANATVPPAAPTTTATNLSSGAGGNGIATVALLATKYREEFEQTFEGLRQRAIKLQEAAPQLITEAQAGIEPYKQELINTVQAVGEVATPVPVVLGTLSWASILVLATTITATISGVVFAPIISVAVGQLGAAALAVGVVPAIGYWSINQDLAASVDDTTIRFRLLSLAGAEGLLVGFVLQNSYLSAAPLAALVLAISAVAYPIAAEKVGNNRQLLLASSVGTAVGATLVLGLLAGNLTLPYLILTALYGAVTATTLQYIYKNVSTDSAPTYTYQLALLTGFIAVNLATHLVFGMSAESYAQYQDRR